MEILGRDISVICRSDLSQSGMIRAIVSSENLIDTTKNTVSFNLNPSKVFLFDDKSEERLF